MIFVPVSQFHFYLPLGAFNQEKVLVGAFSVIVKSSRTFVWSSSYYQAIQLGQGWCSGAGCAIGYLPTSVQMTNPVPANFIPSPSSPRRYLRISYRTITNANYLNPVK